MQSPLSRWRPKHATYTLTNRIFLSISASWTNSKRSKCSSRESTMRELTTFLRLCTALSEKQRPTSKSCMSKTSGSTNSKVEWARGKQARLHKSGLSLSRLRLQLSRSWKSWSKANKQFPRETPPSQPQPPIFHPKYLSKPCVRLLRLRNASCSRSRHLESVTLLSKLLSLRAKRLKPKLSRTNRSSMMMFNSTNRSRPRSTQALGMRCRTWPSRQQRLSLIVQVR